MATVPNFPPAPREPFVNAQGVIARSWFRYLSDLLAVIPGFVNALVSGNGFWKSVDGTLQTAGSAVDLATTDVSGILPAAKTENTAVTPGAYGDATHVSVVVFDAHGRALNASSVPITFPVTSVTGTAPIVAAPTTGAVVVSLADTAVTPGIYGDNGLAVTFTVDAQGRLTNAANTAFYGATDPGQQTIVGSRGGNAALTDLLTKLALTGLIVDATT